MSISDRRRKRKVRNKLADCLRTAYGLAARETTLVVLGSTPRPAYRIGTDGGDWLLKPLADYRPAAALAAAAQLQYKLWHAGAPVARLVATLDGGTVCRTPFGDATLQVWLDGSPGRSGSPADCRATIAALVRALEAGEDCTGPSFLPLDGGTKASLWPDTPHDWAAMLAALEGVAAEHSSRGLRTAVRRVAGDVRALCDAVAWEALPQGLLHGDPGPDNTIFVDGHAYLIDFDDARRGFRIWDPARAVAEYAVEAEASAGGISAHLDEGLLAAMLAEGCGLPDAGAAENAAWEPLVRLSVVSALFSRVNLDWELNGLDPPELMRDATALQMLITTARKALRLAIAA